MANTAVPGPLGDNLAFVWNTWWAAHALKASGFRTGLLFAPWGASLVLHSHTVLPSAIGAALPGLGTIAATNVVVALHLFLNGVCAFALAGRMTRRVAPTHSSSIRFCPAVARSTSRGLTELSRPSPQARW